MSSSFRSKISWGVTKISTRRSPLRALYSPASPSPVRRKCCPSWMPAGTFTEIVFVFLTRPCPSHSLHTCCTVSPRPPHMEHGCDFASVPNGVRYRCSILPLPWHVSHDFSPLPPRPSHFSQRSIRVILTLDRKSV